MSEPRAGNPVLSARQLDRLVLALIIGSAGTVDEVGVRRGVRWAERAVVDAGLLTQILDGRAIPRWGRRGWEYRAATEEERATILEANGSGVAREGGQ